MLAEMYHELGFGGWDHATRKCAAIVVPLNTPVWVTPDFNAIVTAYGIRIGKSRATDLLEIYVDTEGADGGIPSDATTAQQQEYVRKLRTQGWKLFKDGTKPKR